MLRRLIGMLGGLSIAFAMIVAVQMLSTAIYPVPEGLPPAALLLVLSSYALGAFAGGFTAAFIAADRAWPPLIVGTVLLLAGFGNLAAIPHPFWFAAVSTLVYIPAALIGARLVRA